MFPVNIWEGYVLTILWKWFITDVWGVMKINVWQGIGLMLIVKYIIVDYSKSTKDDDDVITFTTKRFVYGIAIPPIILFYGWIIHYFLVRAPAEGPL